MFCEMSLRRSSKNDLSFCCFMLTRGITMYFFIPRHWTKLTFSLSIIGDFGTTSVARLARFLNDKTLKTRSSPIPH